MDSNGRPQPDYGHEAGDSAKNDISTSIAVADDTGRYIRQNSGKDKSEEVKSSNVHGAAFNITWCVRRMLHLQRLR